MIDSLERRGLESLEMEILHKLYFLIRKGELNKPLSKFVNNDQRRNNKGNGRHQVILF